MVVEIQDSKVWLGGIFIVKNGMSFSRLLFGMKNNNRKLPFSPVISFTSDLKQS